LALKINKIITYQLCKGQSTLNRNTRMQMLLTKCIPS